MTQENLFVRDIRKTDSTTMVNVNTPGVIAKVKEEHWDSRVVKLHRGEGLPDRWRSNHGKYEFEPIVLEIKWDRRYWDDNSWGVDIEMRGYRLKKDGTPGERMVKAWWLPQFKDQRVDTPDFVLNLYDEYHPETGSHPYTFAVTKTAKDEIEEGET